MESRLEELLMKERNSIQFQLPSPDIYKYVDTVESISEFSSVCVLTQVVSLIYTSLGTGNCIH